MLQLKAVQLEWNFNWKNLAEKDSVLIPEDTDKNPRHQKMLKKHILALERTTVELRETNEELQNKLFKLEEEVRILQDSNPGNENNDQYDRINGNDIENLIRSNKLTEITPASSTEEKVALLEQQQKKAMVTVANLTRQLSNFDKLHMSMLELLENVESIENKVDKNIPEFRKEISKLEVQVADAGSKIALLKEDQNNVRASMKAIGVSVSNLKDRLQNDELQMKDSRQSLEMLRKSASVQSSKLHDHILKVS